MLLVYLIESEAKAKNEIKEAKFKNDLFIQAFGDREIYAKVYPEEFGMSIEEELANLEFMIPGSEQEALELFREFEGYDDEQPSGEPARNLPLMASTQTDTPTRTG